MLPTNSEGYNIFHAAAVNGVPKPLIKLLSQHRKLAPAALVARDSQGRTPAHLAAICGNLRALRLILDAAPDSVFVRDAKQRNVLDILRHDDTPYTFQLRTRLVAWGPASLGDNPGITPLEQPPLPGTGLARLGPRSVVKMAVSPSQALVVVQNNGMQRSVLATRQLKPLPIEGKFLGASTAQHSVLVTDKSVFTWGHNQHGQLAQPGIKKCDTPAKIDDFLEYRSASYGGFNALSSDHERVPVEPLVDSECNSHYSVAWTTRKLYAWGLNSGQIITKPRGAQCDVTCVYGFKHPIQSVACLDAAIVVLSGNVVSLLMDGGLRKLELGGTDLRGRGRFFALKTETGRLHLYHQKKLDTFTKIPVPKSEPVLSFDVAETGLVVIVTKFTVYTWANGELSELPGSSRYDLRKVCCDTRAASFLASQEYFVPPEITVGGASLVEDLVGICPIECECEPRMPQPFSFFEDNGDFESGDVSFDWDSLPCISKSRQSLSDFDAVLVAEGKSIRMHRFVLLGRCPRLAQALVTTRGGCTVEHKSDKNVFEFSVSFGALVAFVQFLYTGTPRDSPPNSLGKQYRDLQSLAEGSVALGMLRSKVIDPDTRIRLKDGELRAHSSILRTRSLFFAARLGENWHTGEEPVNLEPYSVGAFKLYLDFVYSGQVTKSLATINGSEGQSFQLLVELWFLADELMHTQLAEIVESALVECVNFETCLDVLSIFPGAKTLYSVALDFYSRHMDYYIREFTQIPNALVDSVETGYRKQFGGKVGMNATELMAKLVPVSGSGTATPVLTAATNTPSAGATPTATPPRQKSPGPAKAIVQEPKFQVKQTKKKAKANSIAASSAASAASSATVPTPVSIPRPSPSPSPSPMQIPSTPWRNSAGSSGTSLSGSPSPGPSSIGDSGVPLPRLGQSPTPRLGESKSPPPAFRARTPSAPKRLSQKERLRMQQEAANTPAAPPPTPWGRPATASSSLSEQMALLSQNRQRKAGAGP